jgi:hypothetical protein
MALRQIIFLVDDVHIGGEPDATFSVCGLQSSNGMDGYIVQTTIITEEGDEVEIRGFLVGDDAQVDPFSETKYNDIVTMLVDTGNVYEVQDDDNEDDDEDEDDEDNDEDIEDSYSGDLGDDDDDDD